MLDSGRCDVNVASRDNLTAMVHACMLTEADEPNVKLYIMERLWRAGADVCDI